REMLADTIEVAATRDRIATLYERVIVALSGAPGVLVASGHSSHGYAQGTNIYFTFVMKPDPFARAEEAYLEAWARALQATLHAGGTISPPPGIGRPAPLPRRSPRPRWQGPGGGADGPGLSERRESRAGGDGGRVIAAYGPTTRFVFPGDAPALVVVCRAGFAGRGTPLA